MSSITRKNIFERALKYGSVSDKDSWEKATGQVLYEATIDFLKPNFKVDQEQFLKDPYVIKKYFILYMNLYQYQVFRLITSLMTLSKALALVIMIRTRISRKLFLSENMQSILPLSSNSRLLNCLIRRILKGLSAQNNGTLMKSLIQLQVTSLF